MEGGCSCCCGSSMVFFYEEKKSKRSKSFSHCQRPDVFVLAFALLLFFTRAKAAEMISSVAWLPASAVKPIPRAKPLTEEELAEARRITAQGMMSVCVCVRERERERGKKTNGSGNDGG